MGLKTHKIGIMGGTFDPIHLGHLILGEKAYEQLELEKVYFMPAGNPPHKKSRPGRAEDGQRIEMVRLAIQENPHFSLSTLEMHEDGYTYTYRTLEMLSKEHPNTEYYFIIGADSLFSLESWMHPGRILQACTMAVATRDHASRQELSAQIRRLTEKFHGRFVCLDSPNIDISSQQLRRWVEDGQSLKYYIPDNVIEYIYKNRIYHI